MRPSDLVPLDDPYDAYCLDEAVAHVGTTIEQELDAVKGDNEAAIERGRRAVLDKYFPPAEGTKSQFADPAVMFR